MLILTATNRPTIADVELAINGRGFPQSALTLLKGNIPVTKNRTSNSPVATLLVSSPQSQQRILKTALIRLYKGRARSLWHMTYFAFFLFAVTTVSVTAMPPTVRHYKSSRETFNGPDRTITWRPWHNSSNGFLRIRTGDRYLGGQVWEHYLGFELQQTPIKTIKLSMIRLGSEDIPEEVVIRPGLRYAIVKVTNDMMTAHTGTWSWAAQEVQ